jgi:MFS transporter, DHA3 family, macrolide efflux protein
MTTDVLTHAPPTSMRPFFIVWLGQLVSVTGTGLTGFGLAVWVFQETGSVTSLALVTLAYAAPATLISPFAGALVDRWDRRTVMLVADSGAGAATVAIAALYFLGDLQPWHLYLLIGVGSVANSFQSPAWMASIPLLVPKRQLGRANGLVQLNDGLSLVVAPALAGALIVTVGLGAVLIVDFVTFLVGVTTLLLVRFPRPTRTEETDTGSLLGDAAAGWRYLRQRSGLLGMLVIFAGVNFSMSFGNVLFVPLVVSFASAGAAGLVLSTAGFGAVAGSIAVSASGGPERRIRGVMTAIAVGGVAIVAVGLRASVVTIAIGAFALVAAASVANATSQVVWQLKVAPAVQGRVFAMRRMVSQAVSPIAILLAGPLADRIFEPAMVEGGRLAGTVGSVIGVGPGRGIGLMFVCTGILVTALAIAGYLLPRIRNLETELPDQV